MNKNLDIETSTTPGEALFSNGIAERNNKILYDNSMEDSKLWKIQSVICLQL